MPIGNRIDPLSSEKTIKTSNNKNKIEFKLTDPKYTFNDIILNESVSREIRRALSFREHHDLVFKQWGLENTHRHSRRVCVNFYGPPGTGKTMAAHAVAHHLNKPLMIVNYADIESKYVGETPKNLTFAFETADKNDAILFFDEADAMLSKRVTNMSSATDTSVNQTRSVLLNLLNDYEKTIVFATNFIDNFDSAFMRRILAHINFELPDAECRKRLFKNYVPHNMPNDLNIDILANEYDQLSGSDISNAVLLSAFSAAESNSNHISMNDMNHALTSIINSKKANNKDDLRINEKYVSKSYVEESLGVTV